jgi:hypothetical protein
VLPLRVLGDYAHHAVGEAQRPRLVSDVTRLPGLIVDEALHSGSSETHNTGEPLA